MNAPGLDAPGTYAVLVGTGRHAPGSALLDLPSVETTLDALERALVEICGMAAEHVRRVPGDAGPGAVVAAVEQAAAEASGAVLLYYVGHGLLGPRDELYLATRASRSAESVSEAVPYRTLRDLLGESAAGAVVVLDCCFSGRAAAPGDDRPREPYASARPDGSYLLGSASHFALSFAPEGQPHTLFSGRLLRLLEEGDPSGPPRLTLDHLHTALEREFRGEPTGPRRQSDGSLGRLVVAHNRAYRPAPGPAVAPPADVPCPYPGMEAFRPEDSGHFFGREHITRRLLDTVCAPGDRTPVVLVGASGAGKSSLLRAGLLAGVERRYQARPDDHLPWPALLLPAPGAHPLRALAALWARATGRPVDETLTALDTGRFPGPLSGRRPCRLLVVDQFEEVYTRCRDPREAARFVALLTGEGPGHPRVVLGLRADHYGSALTHPGLARALEHGQLAVPPMDESALRSAIEAPAEAAGLTLEDGLTTRLLHDLRQGHEGPPGPGAALPFLAHALRETWLRRSGAALTLAGYHATGGIWRSVTTTTERLYQSLDGPGRDVLRALLLRLVHLTADGTEPVVARRTGSDALLDGLTPRQRQEAAEILEKLAATRLLTVDRDEARISHEALLRAWPRLRRWIDEDRAGLLERQRLAEAADEWQTSGRDPAYLYRGARLENADSVVRPAPSSRRGPLRRLEQEFLEAGRAAVRAESDRERRRTQRLKRLLVVLAGGLCLALVSGLFAYQQWGEAAGQRRLATQRTLLAAARNLRETEPAASLRLGLAAHREWPSTDARTAVFDTLRLGRLRDRIPAPTSAGGTTALSPDGTTRAAREGKGEKARLVLRDVRDTPRRSRPAVLAGCRLTGGGLAFSGDGKTLAADCGNDTVGLWRLGGPSSAPRRVATVRAATPAGGGALALDTKGGLLAVESRTGEVELHSTAGTRETQSLRRTSPTGSVATLRFSPDGHLLVATTRSATTRDGRVELRDGTLWSLADRRRPPKPVRIATGGGPVVFTPDSRTFLTSQIGTLDSWDVSDPAAPRQRSHQPSAHSQDIQSIAVSHDGTTMATGGGDRSVLLWDLTSGPALEQTAALTLHEHSVSSLAFAPDDQSFVSADQRLTARWKTATRHPTQSAGIEDRHGIRSLAYSPDGESLVTGAADGSVTVRDAAGRRIAGPWREHTGAVTALALSHDGKLLASGDAEGTVRVWDVGDNGALRKTGTTFTRDRPVSTLRFAPGGQVLWADGGGRRTPFGIDPDFPPWNAAWDLSRPGHPRSLARETPGSPTFSSDGRLALLGRTLADGPTAVVKTRLDALPATSFVLALHPDGRTLAAGDWGSDQRVQLWDISDPTAPHRLGATEGEGDAYLTRRLRYHPGGNLLAETSAEGVVTLYDVGRPTHPRRIAVLAKLATQVEFSPDGTHVATIGADGNVAVWDIADLTRISADPITWACELAGGPLTATERERYAPSLPHRSACD
ncbi:hypothetical protein [Streptomyces sp. NPDC007088]|uniref:caspase, EACC1-associated type n=1 Tax=Streptomyces sp. NPDC007088 TaxID=3364773 RepID=UPI00367C1AB2